LHYTNLLTYLQFKRLLVYRRLRLIDTAVQSDFLLST